MKLVQMMGGSTTRLAHPPLPEGAERWGLNNIFMSHTHRARFKGWTRWFDLHGDEHIQGRKQGRRNCYPWLCAQTRPIYRWSVDPNMPASVVYPDAARQGSRLFCSSLDWMLALAIHEHFTHIDLFGWRMTHPAYQHQVGSAQWWVHKAISEGITVTIHGNSALKVKVAAGPPPPIVIPAGCLMYGRETTDRSKLYHA